MKMYPHKVYFFLLFIFQHIYIRIENRVLPTEIFSKSMLSVVIVSNSPSVKMNISQI